MNSLTEPHVIALKAAFDDDSLGSRGNQGSHPFLLQHPTNARFLVGKVGEPAPKRDQSLLNIQGELDAILADGQG